MSGLASPSPHADTTVPMTSAAASSATCRCTRLMPSPIPFARRAILLGFSVQTADSGLPGSERLRMIVSCRRGVNLDRAQRPPSIQQVHDPDRAVLVGEFRGIGGPLGLDQQRFVVALHALGSGLE